MPGILVYGSYGQFYSFMIADNYIYKKTKSYFLDQENMKVLYGKGNLTLEKIQGARDKINEIVKRLNDKEKVNVRKELSGYFTK